ncbi:MAG: hypothetical protein RJB13_597, partial [Pseudomonadota bacterium]
MKHVGFKRRYEYTLFGLLSALAVAVAPGCQMDSGTDESAAPQWMQTPKLDDASVSSALASTLALRINLKSNRITLYKSGKVADQWNIASADVTGEFHDNQPQSTPTGIFAVEDMQACPEWLPRAPQDPKTGKVASNEKERWEIIKANPELFGACGKSNPLGHYAIWFHGAYGVHGNSAEWILELNNPEERRVSGGCIRNPNRKIKELFHLVIDSFPQIAAYRNEVTKLESSASKVTKTQSLKGVDFKVVVGNWSQDPAVGSDATQPQLEPTPSPPVVTETQIKCPVVAVDNTLGIAPTHEMLPATAHNVVSFYSLGDSAIVKEVIVGTNYVRTLRGIVDKKYLG